MAVTRALAWVEFKLFLRDPVTVVFTLALPPLQLYVLSEVFGNRADPEVYGGIGPVDYYTPAYIGLVIASLGLIGLPAHLAGYRERGVLRRFRAARIPVRSMLVAQLGVVFAGVLVGGALLVMLARLTYHIHWPVSWLGVLLSIVLGGLAFAALGALLGALLPTPRAAQGVGVLLWFAMLILGGAGPPPEVMSEGMRRVGDALPLKHLIIAVQDPWLGRPVNWARLLVLVGLLVVAAGGAALALRSRD